MKAVRINHIFKEIKLPGANIKPCSYIAKLRARSVALGFSNERRLATSRPLGERSEPFLAVKRPTASDEAPYEIRRRTFLKV